MTLVEPMVCLLVSEEEDGDARASREARGRVCSEAETQTEAETQIGTDTWTETLESDNETLERGTKTASREERMQGETQTSRDRRRLQPGERNKLGFKLEFKEIPSAKQISQMEQIIELQEEVNFDENDGFESA